MIGEVTESHEKVTCGQEPGGFVGEEYSMQREVWVQRPCGEQVLGKFQEAKRPGDGREWRTLLAMKSFVF